MNETRGNARTKPMRGGLKGGEINSLKDSEKTNECILNICCFFNIINELKTGSIRKTFIIKKSKMNKFIKDLDIITKKHCKISYVDNK